jgi:hypothetical protein
MTAPSTSDIVLLACNARWTHASFALRCLKANLGALKDRCTIVERTIDDRAVDVVEALGVAGGGPRVLGLSVYIWNAPLMLEIARMVRALWPDTVVVVGGPEVSHEIEEQEICRLAHHVVKGEGEVAFRRICEAALRTQPLLATALDHVVDGGTPDLAALASPYEFYDDVDVNDRVVYVEASRGCPFTCEFCLSSLDVSVRNFPFDAFLADMQRLLDRGLLSFKFIDRTFNLKMETTERIVTFFLERMRPGLFVHFEMVPDRLPDSLRGLLARFPPGSVQLEVGIQTFDADVGVRIRRKQDVAKLEDNLRYLRAHTGVHIHADLIAGLPGESLASFGAGFDRLWALAPHEIQIGILKRLRGAPIARHTAAHSMVYAESPPYEVLRTDALSFVELQRIKRFARFFDLVVNHGRFLRTAQLLMQAESPFFAFLAFSDWLFAETRARHGIALPRLAELLGRHLIEVRGLAHDDVHAAIVADLGKEKLPTQLQRGIPARQLRHVQR